MFKFTYIKCCYCKKVFEFSESSFRKITMERSKAICTHCKKHQPVFTAYYRIEDAEKAEVYVSSGSMED